MEAVKVWLEIETVYLKFARMRVLKEDSDIDELLQALEANLPDIIREVTKRERGVMPDSASGNADQHEINRPYAKRSRPYIIGWEAKEDHGNIGKVLALATWVEVIEPFFDPDIPAAYLSLDTGEVFEPGDGFRVYYASGPTIMRCTMLRIREKLRVTLTCCHPEYRPDFLKLCDRFQEEWVHFSLGNGTMEASKQVPPKHSNQSAITGTARLKVIEDLVAQHRSDKEIAANLNLTRPYVTQLRTAHGIPPGRKRGTGEPNVPEEQ
jgi:hypothetical protein